MSDKRALKQDNKMKPRSKRAASRKHERHKEQTVISVFGRTCNGCAVFKKWTLYSPTTSSYTGHTATCKSCRSKTGSKDFIALKNTLSFDNFLANNWLQGRGV